VGTGKIRIIPAGSATLRHVICSKQRTFLMVINLQWKGCRTVSKEKKMLGWMIVFAMIAVLGAVLSLSGNPATSVRIAGLVFSSLFFLGLLTYAVRGRAR
jgi:uncharacterized membrane protein YtjA (UPF0391 family)